MTREHCPAADLVVTFEDMPPTEPAESEVLLERLAARLAEEGVDGAVEARVRGGRLEVLVGGISIEARLRLDGDFDLADAVAAHEAGGDWDAYFDAIVTALR